MKTDHGKKGFTLIELLTTIAVIALLLGFLIPALNAVRNTAKKTRQRAQFISIEQSLMSFKGEMGYYPPSNWIAPIGDYCGTQKFTEALVGWDLLGFHKDSDFRALGAWVDGGVYDAKELNDPDNLSERIGPYLETGKANVYALGDLYTNTAPLDGNRFVICDTYSAKKITVTATGEVEKVGSPILYYRANTSSKTMTDQINYDNNIYNFFDNSPIIFFGRLGDGAQHSWFTVGDFYSDQPGGILDPKVTAITGVDRPYKPDSYILISAGPDGLYGNEDDITNFNN